MATLVRAFAEVANDLPEARYSSADAEALRAEVDHYEKVRLEVKLASGDFIDLKLYEPAMRHLIDSYIRAEESVQVSALEDASLVQLLVERGPAAVDALPDRHLPDWRSHRAELGELPAAHARWVEPSSPGS